MVFKKKWKKTCASLKEEKPLLEDILGLFAYEPGYDFKLILVIYPFGPRNAYNKPQGIYLEIFRDQWETLPLVTSSKHHLLNSC